MAPTENGYRQKRRAYRCFLLRCWLEQDAGLEAAPGWRFAVQQVGADSARRAFTCFSDVAVYLEAELAASGAGFQAGLAAAASTEPKEHAPA
jgi:hypothetical protein